MTPSRALVLVCLCSRPLSAAAAETPWLEARSAHFRVVTDDGEKSARRLTLQFERIRGVFQQQWKWARVDGGEPVVIVAVKDEKRMKALLPGFWERKNGARPVGLFVPGPDKNSLIVRLDFEANDDNPYEILYHEYTHRILSLNFASMPLWLNEGLAEFYGGTRIDDEGLRQGMPRREHLLALRESGLLPLETLFKVDQTSPHYGEERRASIFYAQSWALVHYFILGDKGVHGAALDEFVRAIASGSSAEEASKALGDLKALEKTLGAYVSRPAFYFRKMTGREAQEENPIELRPLSAAESQAVQAEMLLRTGRTGEARARIDEALKLEPGLPAVHETLALVHLREGKSAEARQSAARAIELGTAGFYTHHLHGALSLRNGSWTEEAERSLRRAIELNSLYAPSQAALAHALSRQKDNQKEAAGLARRAVALQPADVQNRLSMAQVLLATDDTDEARALLASLVARSPDASVREAASGLLAKAIPKDPVRKAAFYQKGCEGGAATDCVRAGELYAHGTGVAKDDPRAAELFRSACEQGSAEGCAWRGQFLDQGRGGPRDSRQAVELWDKACEAGNAWSCAKLGEAARTGSGVPQDAARAVRLHEKACAGASTWGCRRLAFLYEKGKGVPEDLVRARSLYEKSCSGGDGEGCDDLAWMHKKGRGGAVDLAKALELFDKGCRANSLDSCESVGMAYERGDGVAADLGKAASVYQDACNRRHMSSCSSLGYLYTLGKGVSRDRTRAAELFTKACDGGDGPACDQLGLAYEYGEGVTADPSRAHGLYQKSCDLGEPDGCASLGRSFDQGIGVAPDTKRAAEFVRKGCDGGHGPSCVVLAQAYSSGRGVPLDGTRALALMKKACEAKYERVCPPEAQTPEQRAEAVRVAEEACAADRAVSCGEAGAVLAELSEHARAFQLFKKGCALGDVPSCTRLGSSYLFGRGVARDPVQAKALLTKACAANDSSACEASRLLP